MVHNTKTELPLLNEKQKKQMQHDLKVYMEKYWKQKLGKGVEYTRILLCEDVLMVGGEGFLTEPEHYIARDEAGIRKVRESRMEVVYRHFEDNIPYFEEKLHAKVIRQLADVDVVNDFWMHVMFFDRILVEP